MNRKLHFCAEEEKMLFGFEVNCSLFCERAFVILNSKLTLNLISETRQKGEEQWSHMCRFIEYSQPPFLNPCKATVT